MTNKELQEKLKQFPDSARIVFYDENGHAMNELNSLQLRYNPKSVPENNVLEVEL